MGRVKSQGKPVGKKRWSKWELGKSEEWTPALAATWSHKGEQWTWLDQRWRRWKQTRIQLGWWAAEASLLGQASPLGEVRTYCWEVLSCWWEAGQAKAEEKVHSESRRCLCLDSFSCTIHVFHTRFEHFHPNLCKFTLSKLLRHVSSPDQFED